MYKHLPILSPDHSIVSHAIVGVVELLTVEHITAYHDPCASLPGLAVYAGYVPIIELQPIIEVDAEFVYQPESRSLVIIEWELRDLVVELIVGVLTLSATITLIYTYDTGCIFCSDSGGSG
jgi:hypothetical protein